MTSESTGARAISLRPFTPADYAAITNVMNRAAPYFPVSEAAVRNRDECRPAFCVLVRLVAQRNGDIIGVGEIHQRADQYHPRRFLMSLYVDPAQQKQNIGGRLYDRLTTELRGRNAETVRGFAREDRPDDVQFWQKRGFVEAMRDGGAVLPLTTFNPAQWAEAEALPTRTDGLQIVSFASLAHDSDRDRKLHALFNAILADVPPRGERTPVDFSTFVKQRLERTGFLPDALFLAVTPKGEYIGAHQLLVPPSGETDILATGLTGILPEWRRKGVALALKVRGLRCACEKGGIKTVKTWNASDNLPIIRLNEKLGFAREPWRIHLLKTF